MHYIFNLQEIVEKLMLTMIVLFLGDIFEKYRYEKCEKYYRFKTIKIKIKLNS